jgi:hypothetical protein
MKKVNKFEAMRKLQNKNKPKVAGSMIQGGLIKYQTRGEVLAMQAMEQLGEQTPFADFYETFPVNAKGTAMLGSNYISQQTYADKRRLEKAANQLSRQIDRDTRRGDKEVKKKKGKGRRNNPSLKGKKAGPQTTEKFMCTGVGCHQ